MTNDNKLHIAVVCFVTALISALFGFGGIAPDWAAAAKVIFFVFTAIAVAFFCWSLRDAS